MQVALFVMLLVCLAVGVWFSHTPPDGVDGLPRALVIVVSAAAALACTAGIVYLGPDY